MDRVKEENEEEKDGFDMVMAWFSNWKSISSKSSLTDSGAAGEGGRKGGGVGVGLRFVNVEL